MLINLPISTHNWTKDAKQRLVKAIKVSVRQLYEQILEEPERYGFEKEQFGE